MRKPVNLLGIPVANLNLDDILELIGKTVEANPSGCALQLVTLNPLIFKAALDIEKLYKIISKSFLVIPESIGIKLLGLAYFVNLRRSRGIDILRSLLELAEEKKCSVYLLGASKDVIEKARSNILKKYSSLSVVGYRDGYFTKDEEAIVLKDISEKSPDFLFVGLDTPRQELFIGENLDKLRVGIAMGVGGSFDCIAGRLKVAPPFMRFLGIEWLFRTIQEPWRVGRIFRVPLFLIRALLIRFKILKIKFTQ